MTGPRAVQDYWYRLRAMEPSEVAHHVLDRALRWTEPAARRGLAGVMLPGRVATFPQLPMRQQATPMLRAAVAEAASAIRAGRWILYGWKEAQVSDPPDWHRDYARDAASDGAAEPRNVWEANRWSELVRLAQHAWLSQEREDARLVQRWLLDWCEKNPLGVGVNWKSGLEAAVRLVNFCWIDALIRGSGDAALKAAQVQLAQRVVPAHAWWVWRRRAIGSSANNHLIGELAGLVLAARRWPTVAQLCGSAERLWEQLSREVLRQFAPDGGNREQALHYHQFAWQLVWQAHRVMGRLPGPVAERLRAAALFLSDCTHAEEPWHFGDSDDAEPTPFTAGRRSARVEWQAWLTGAPSPALHFWLGRPPALPRVRGDAWRVYPESGLAVRDVHRWKARLDASPLGWGRIAAHGHLDALHFSLWDGPHAVVVDPGTGAYLGDRALRDRLASWAWHNGPVPVSGLARPQRRGAFVWSDHHAAPELTLDGSTCVARREDGACRFSRAVRYDAETDAWSVDDDTPADGPCVVRWRLAPPWRVDTVADGVITLTRHDGDALRMTFVSEDLRACEVSEDIVSPHFGDVRRGAVIALTFVQRLVTRWVRE